MRRVAISTESSLALAYVSNEDGRCGKFTNAWGAIIPSTIAIFDLQLVHIVSRHKCLCAYNILCLNWRSTCFKLETQATGTLNIRSFASTRCTQKRLMPLRTEITKSQNLY